MTETKRGDHVYVDHDNPTLWQAGYLPKPVSEAEHAAVIERRNFLTKNVARDRTGYSSYTGLAISGGGIRSASFGLGALQALHAESGIEGIDYLLTVSGGGYVGCSLTAATQISTTGKNSEEIKKLAETQTAKDRFPFTNPENYEDTDSVRHIRDYSNYLAPHGALDVITALGIIGRGLVANILIVLPVLLLCVWLTLFNHPTVESLTEPNVLVKLLPRAWLGLTNSDSFQDLWGLDGYWFTIILGGVNVIFLVIWAFAKSIYVSQFWQNEIKSRRQLEYGAELRGPFVSVSRWLFFITLTSAWFETQPFILRAMAAPASDGMGVCANSVFSSECLGAVLHGWFTRMTLLAPFGAAFVFLSKYLGDIIALTKSDTRWRAWIKKILAMAALGFSAIIIPSFLWLLYLKLTYYSISKNTHYANAPDWLRQVAHVMLRWVHWLQYYPAYAG